MAELASAANAANAAQLAASGITASGRKDAAGGRFEFDDGGTYCGGWEEGKAHGAGVCTGPKGQGEYAGSWHYGFEVSGVYTWPSGSTFEGHWQNGKRHGLGIESRGRWLYRGEWTQGFKGRYGVRQAVVNNAKYEGTWANGLQDGYGSETYADGGTYQGQWLRGLRHGYGVRTSAPFGMASYNKLSDTRMASMNSLNAEAAGPVGPTIPSALADGEPVVMETGNGTAAEGAGGTGSPNLAAAGVAGVPGSSASASGAAISRRGEEARGGFVLRAKSDDVPQRRRSLVERTGMKGLVQGLKLKKQRSTGDLDRKGVTSIRSTGSTTSWMSSESGFTTGASVMSEGSNQSFALEDEQLDANVTETYMGEWKNDKRCGFGISERSDGLKYEGEWYNNRKYGYGVTTHRGIVEEGKYKNNVLVTSNQKRHLFLIRSAKFRERIDSAINAAQRASKIALQKADIAISRTATARGKAEQADIAAYHAREDAQLATAASKQFGPDGTQLPPGSNPTAMTTKTAEPNRPMMGNATSKVASSNLLSVKNQAANNISSRPKTPEVVVQSPTAVNKAPAPAPVAPAPAPVAPAPAQAKPSFVPQQTAQQPEAPAPMASQAAPQPRPSTAQRPASGIGAAAGAPASSGFGGVGAGAQNPQSQFPNNAPTSNNVMNIPKAAAMNRPQFNNTAAAPPPVAAAAPMMASNFAPPPTTPASNLQTAAVAPSTLRPAVETNCDITSTTTDNMLSRMVNHIQARVPGGAAGAAGAGASQMNAPGMGASSLGGLGGYGAPSAAPRGRSPAGGSARGRPGGMQAPPEASGGYNFQRIMDDHFEHYKRPASSREHSVDPKGPAAGVMPEVAPAGGVPGRPGSRVSSRAPSRTRGTPLPMGASHTDMDLDVRRKELEMSGVAIGLGGVTNGDAAHAEDGAGVRYRGAPPSQEVGQLGTIPKRTESLYLKQSLDSKGKDTPQGTLQRKKSLPDVQCLDVTTQAQGSKAMTREEISVLSSARREAVRRQLEEIERYKSNPFLYILNPRVTEWISRQRLLLFILFVNLSLAIMFFQLLS